LRRGPLVVDSSVLIALSKSGDLERSLRRRILEGYEVLVPRAIMWEVVDEPLRLAEEMRGRSPVLAERIRASAECIGGVIGAGLVKIEDVDYVRYSKVMDGVRKYLGEREGKPEHVVGKGDPELVALVAQLRGKSGERVLVATQDKGLRRVLTVFLGETDYDVVESL